MFIIILRGTTKSSIGTLKGAANKSRKNYKNDQVTYKLTGKSKQRNKEENKQKITKNKIADLKLTYQKIF